jgi:hypothetical protein
MLKVNATAVIVNCQLLKAIGNRQDEGVKAEGIKAI